MTSVIQMTLLRGLVVTALVLPGMSGLVEGGELEALLETYDAKRQQRQKLVTEMEQLEEEYRQIVDRIDEMKQEGTDQLPNRRSIRDLMRRSRRVASDLEARQKELTKLDGRLRQLRSAIHERIDDRMESLERELAEADDQRRQKIVDQLNELRRIAGEHETELPEAPDPAEVRETLEMATEVPPTRPDQMAAAADALEDTEDQVTERLDAIDRELQDLERAKTLTRRARTFRSEEQFFDEESRPHQVRRREGGESTAEGSGSADQGDSAPNESGASEGSETDQSAGSGAGDQENQQGNFAPSEPGADRPPSDQDGARAGAPEEGQTGESVDSRDSAPEVAPGDSGSNETSNPGGSKGEFVLESQADPSTSVNPQFESSDKLESRIDELEEEREELEEQAEKLREEAERLRERADDPGASE